MDENKTVKVPLIKEDAIVSVEMSNYFLKRIKSLYYYLLKDKDEKEVLDIFQKLAQPDEKIEENPELFHILTLIILISDVEHKLKDGGFIEEVDIEYPKTQD
jgi:hypothetical protein